MPAIRFRLPEAHPPSQAYPAPEPYPAAETPPARQAHPARQTPGAPGAHPAPEAGRFGDDEPGLVPGMRRPVPRPRPAAEPPWARVIATTVALWFQRRAGRAGPPRAPGAGWIRLGLVLLGVAVAASVGLLLGRNAGTAPDFSRSGPANPVQAAQAARVQAATWVAGQVSRSAIVSCDPVMCSALQARGFPASDLDPLGPSAPDPLDSSLVVATSVLRSQFGSRLGTVYAPVVLASFGTGSAAIQVRAVAPGGASAYLRQLNADFTARKAVGSQLLRNPNVVAGPAARRQLELGQVDARLITTIGTMAHSYAVRILAFGDAAPGAAAEVPLRSASLGSLASGTAATAVLNSVRSFLEAQQSPYLPAVTRIMRLATGQMAVNVQFAAPDPLGLLDAGPAVVNIGSPG